MKRVFTLLMIFISLFMFIDVIDASEISFIDSVSVLEVEEPEFDFYGGSMNCSELLGTGLTKILNFVIDAIRIIGVIVSLIMAMISLIPAVTKGDQGELNKAIRKCIWIAVVLFIIALFPLLVRVVGNLFEFDTSCIQ